MEEGRYNVMYASSFVRFDFDFDMNDMDHRGLDRIGDVEGGEKEAVKIS